MPNTPSMFSCSPGIGCIFCCLNLLNGINWSSLASFFQTHFHGLSRTCIPCPAPSRLDCHQGPSIHYFRQRISQWASSRHPCCRHHFPLPLFFFWGQKKIFFL